MLSGNYLIPNSKSNEYKSTEVVDCVICFPSLSISTNKRLLGTNLLGLGAVLTGCDLFRASLVLPVAENLSFRWRRLSTMASNSSGFKTFTFI